MLEKMRELIVEGLGVDAEQELVAEQFAKEPEEVTMSTSFEDDLGADSLDLFELVMSFEEEFGVSIPSEELEKMNTVGDVMNYIESNQ